MIVLTCFVLGLRFLMYSAAMAPYLKPLPARWQQALAFLLTDQAFAAAIRRFDAKDDPPAARTYFLGSGMRCGCAGRSPTWPAIFAGNLIPAAWSLEFAVPLCFHRAGRAAACATRRRSSRRSSPAVAVIALDALPMRLNLIAAGVIGIVAGTLADLTRERWTRR